MPAHQLPLVTETDTLARILAAVRPLASEAVPLRAALGRFVVRDTLATVPLPGFDNSSMDGYALARGEEPAGWPAGAEFRVVGEQPAGRDRGLRLTAGQPEAARIFTGAPLPAGTGAVVMQEDVQRSEAGGEARIVLKAAVEPGEFIRRAGGDLARGQRLLAAGEKLGAAALAVLATQGIAEVEVGRRPRVAILMTGDELRSPGDGRGPLASGEIFESNGTMLAALAAGIVGDGQVNVLPHAPDEPAALDALLRRGLEEHDALVVAGGDSVGERDLVRPRLEALGARLELWRVRVKPGKPFVYGRGPAEGTHVFGLPGNPVSAFVTFLLFVRPALLRMMGAGDASLALPAFPATTTTELSNAGADRPHYLRGRLDAEGRFSPSGRQESHALAGLSRSRALVRLEPDAVVPAGGPVRALLWEL